ncbi:hypothetical protein SFRURICE_001668 [Spodoptera frugiperda]|nr:hypothetical protein SFRURICE_001668 [Spodoptera frugiperda]
MGESRRQRSPKQPSRTAKWWDLSENIAVSAVNPRGQPSPEKFHSSGIPTYADNVTCGDVNSATSSVARRVTATSYCWNFDGILKISHGVWNCAEYIMANRLTFYYMGLIT